MDMRENEVSQILEPEGVLAQRSLERPQTGGGTTIDERGLFAGKQVRGNYPRPPEVQEIEKLDAT
jgi:hypothetical protein